MDILQFSPFLNSRPEDLASTFESVRRVLDSLIGLRLGPISSVA
jgi:hypothetical protein